MDNDAIINLTELNKFCAVASSVCAKVDSFERILHQCLASRKLAENADSDCWLDAEGARKYMGNMSKTTFDKYRYSTIPCIPGHKLDGKVLYKKSDLDSFVRLYEIKSTGLA